MCICGSIREQHPRVRYFCFLFARTGAHAACVRHHHGNRCILACLSPRVAQHRRVRFADPLCCFFFLIEKNAFVTGWKPVGLRRRSRGESVERAQLDAPQEQNSLVRLATDARLARRLHPISQVVGRGHQTSQEDLFISQRSAHTVVGVHTSNTRGINTGHIKRSHESTAATAHVAELQRT